MDGMIRVLSLSGREPDFQTERAAASLRGHLGAGFEVTPRSIGHGGDWRNVPLAVLGPRRGLRAGAFDLVHAWDEAALTAAAVEETAPAADAVATELRLRGRSRGAG